VDGGASSDGGDSGETPPGGGPALPQLLPESRRITAPRTWLAAIAYAATLVLFVMATKLTTSANAISSLAGGN
jgi:hypothetical protein